MRILDVAFTLAKESHNAVSHAEAKGQLQKKYPDVEWNGIVVAYTKACDLADACYDFGDKCRLKWMTNDEAMAAMRKPFPGFSGSTYRAALSHGYFISR